MLHFLRTLSRGLVGLVYPGVCLACGQLTGDGGSDFCGDCRDELVYDPFPTCERCASTIGPNLPTAGPCVSCRDTVFHFDRAVRMGPYEGLRRELILQMKKSCAEGLAEAIGELWAGSVEGVMRGLGVQVVIPVPLHWRRAWQRGYNQSEVLARVLAARLNVPYRPRWLKRIRNTKPQQGSRTFRQENARGAFRASKLQGINGTTVLLVDDVLTTGSTASESARALKQAGAARVIAAVVGHG